MRTKISGESENNNLEWKTVRNERLWYCAYGLGYWEILASVIWKFRGIFSAVVMAMATILRMPDCRTERNLDLRRSEREERFGYGYAWAFAVAILRFLSFE